MSIVFKPFSVSNDYMLSGVYGVITDNVGMCIRNSYVNNGTGVANLTNNSKGYIVNCNDNYDQIKELVVLADTTSTGDADNLTSDSSNSTHYLYQQLTNFGVNCALSKNSSFSTDFNNHNIYQDVFTDNSGSVYNFPNYDNTIPLINILNSSNKLLMQYFRKQQMYSDYSSNITYSYGTIVYYSGMYFMCLKNSTKDIIPGSDETSSKERWGAYSIADNVVYNSWDDNHEYQIGDIVYYDYNFYKCKFVEIVVNGSTSNVAGKVPISELGEISDFWEPIDVDKTVLQFKYSDFVDVIAVPEWDVLVNYQYSDVVKYNDKCYVCINSSGVTDTTDILNPYYWTLDARFDEKFENVYRRFDNLFVNDGNVLKFTNKSYLKEDTIFKVKNLLDVEILQKYIPRNLNGHKLTIEIHGRELNNCINESVIHSISGVNDRYYLSQTNNRSSFDPTNEKMLTKFVWTNDESNNPYLVYSEGEPITKPTTRDITASYVYRPTTAKFNISGFYGGYINVRFINGESKKIITNRQDKDYFEGYGICTVPTEDGDVQYYVDTIPCSFTFKDIYGKLKIDGDKETSDGKTRVTLNTVKSDGYILKFVNCENVEINDIQFYMSYPNKYGAINVGDTISTVTPNDCYESFIIFDNCKAVVKNCWFKFLYYRHSDHQLYIRNTYKIINDSNGNLNKYVFNHDFAGCNTGDVMSNDTYIIEGLITCENNTQCLIDNVGEMPNVFTNIGSCTNYVCVLSNSQVTWHSIGLYNQAQVRENMLQYLERHIADTDYSTTYPKPATGAPGLYYKNTNLSINSAEFFNGPAMGNDYPVSLSKKILKSSIWKRILRNYNNIQADGEDTLPLTPQMLYAFLKMWMNTDIVEVTPNGMDQSNNNYFNKASTTPLTTSVSISDSIKNDNWNLTIGKFKAAKILVDLLKTVEQSINFDVKNDDDKSTTSYDTTQATGTAVEYKHIEKTVDTTLLDSIQNLISLLTINGSTPTVNDNMNVEFLNACAIEDNFNLKPKSLINGSLDVFETVLTRVCDSVGVPSPTYDLSTVTDVADGTTNGVTVSKLTINFIGKRSELNKLGYKIASNFNYNIFYPLHDEYFYDAVYVPEDNENLSQPVTTFSYDQEWSPGIDLLGGSRGSSVNVAGGLWDDNTRVVMNYGPINDNSPITDDTQCVITISFIAPKILFTWMRFFENIDNLNWTCKSFMGVVQSLLVLFGEGNGTDGKPKMFTNGYGYAYNPFQSTDISSNPFYLIWFYLFNPTTATGSLQKSLQIAEQLYVINQLLSNFSSTTCGLLNHHHIFPELTSQDSGIPIGTVGVTWRTYLLNCDSVWSFPDAYYKAKNGDFGSEVLYDKLDKNWKYCDGSSYSALTDSDHTKKILMDVYKTNGVVFNEWSIASGLSGCLEYTSYQPFINASISGSAMSSAGDSRGSQTVVAQASMSTDGPFLQFTHTGPGIIRGVNIDYNVSFGWNGGSDWHGGTYNKTNPTKSFKELFDQMGYKLKAFINGTDTLIPDVSTNGYSGSIKESKAWVGKTYTISNFRIVDADGYDVKAFKFAANDTGGSESHTTYGGRYDPIPATKTVKAGCESSMYRIITELIYAIKVANNKGDNNYVSNTATSKFPTMLRSSAQPQVSDIRTPNIYYNDEGVVYNISFDGFYDNYTNLNKSVMDLETFESNIWTYTGVNVEQTIDGDIDSHLIYKYVDNKLYCSSDMVIDYIKMCLIDFNQMIKSLFNSKTDHHYGYSINIGDEQYNNIPADMIINSVGSNSNDLTLLSFYDKNGEQIVPNGYVSLYGLTFDSDVPRYNTNVSNFNYKSLIGSGVKTFEYNQYIEVSRLNKKSIDLLTKVFGENYQDNLSNYTVDETILLDMVYDNNQYYTVDVYKETNKVRCVVNTVKVNGSVYIRVTTTIKNITQKEIKSFVNSLDQQIQQKYTVRGLSNYIELYHNILDKCKLNVGVTDSAIPTSVFESAREELWRLNNEI